MKVFLCVTNIPSPLHNLSVTPESVRRKKIEQLFMTIKVFHAAFDSLRSLLVHYKAKQFITQECSGMFTCTARQNLEKNCDPCVQFVM